MENFIYQESNRCLNCKTKNCQNFCPIGTEIPEVLNLIKENKKNEAGKILLQNNPLSLVCSVICPFERQCMGNCVRGIKGKPINFPAVESYIMEKYLNKNSLENKHNNKVKIAIIGAGPAGISAAFYLRRKNYDVTIFDENKKIGGMLRYGIPDFRLTKNKVDLLEKKILETGIKFIGNTKINQENLYKLKEENFKAVLAVTGAWVPKKLNISGEEKENVYYGLDYLKNRTNIGSGKKVIVIGAGNVAMDVARTIKRQGNDVIVAYRKRIEEAPATKMEIEETRKDGVEFITEVVPIKILDDGIILKNKKNQKEEIIKCDNIIVSIGQESELKKEEKDGYFYAGDLETGPKTVVEASSTGKKAAQKIIEYLNFLTL